jgi:ABC-type multidrug transport system ATPase subunit
VERVSDYVAILDHGRMVASSSTAELLDGDSTTYELTIRGDEQATLRALRTHPWVSDIRSVSQNGSTALTISVTDERAADSGLLRSVIATDDIVVTAFGRRHFNLEDVFLQLVKGQGE